MSSPILRKDIPTTKNNRAMCCVYGVIDTTGASRDLVCGVKTKKFWDKEAECFDYKPFCPEHQAKVTAQDLAEIDAEE